MTEPAWDLTWSSYFQAHTVHYNTTSEKKPCLCPHHVETKFLHFFLCHIPRSIIRGFLKQHEVDFKTISYKLRCMHDKSLQSYLTLCNPMDCSLPGSSVHVILQARILEWVAVSSSKYKSWRSNQIKNIKMDIINLKRRK